MAEGFELRATEDGRAGLWFVPEPRWKPLVFRWDAPVFLRRVKSVGAGDLLGRALRGRSKELPVVCDATLGLGQDALSLLHLGFHVIGVERNPLLCALWREALEVYADDPFWGPRQRRFQFLEGDAASILPSVPCDVIYLDPMHEPKRTAVPRREMRMLRLLVGDDTDSGSLLRAATGIGARVVVKRSDGDPPLGGPAPHHVLKGSTVRFDVYEPR
ncbi:MAG: class I SAM-dependent methyltransferase [Bdellovibrionales bacterium]|nr:class I SAM-dependent methyltransferase [Bdellovibrionales bacterium]